MKKCVSIVLFIYSFSSFVVGQSEKPISKGHFLAGGIISFESITSVATIDKIQISQRTNSLELSPNFGFFLIDKLALGLKANTIITRIKYLTIGDLSKENKLIISPFIRYYVYSDFFGEFDFGYGKIRYGEDTGTIFRGLFCIGYSMFLNDNISLEPVISLNKYKENWKSNLLSDNKQATIKFSLSLQVFF